MNETTSPLTASASFQESLKAKSYKRLHPNPPVQPIDRHALLEVDGKPYFFKGARKPQVNVCMFHDMVGELICSRLGTHLGMPVPLMIPHSDPAVGSGFGLVSEYSGNKSLSPTDDPSLILNLGDFPKALVFEQWVLNVDDKKDHFLLQPVGDKFRFWIIDHGHTFHSWRKDISPDLSVPENLLFDASSNHFPYRISNRSELESGIALIKGIEDSLVKIIVDESFEDIREIGKSNSLYKTFHKDFFQKEDDHKKTILKILTVRKDHLEKIMANKWERPRTL
jgi:hypothetical protein